MPTPIPSPPPFTPAELDVDLRTHGFTYACLEGAGARIKYWHGGLLSGPLLILIPGGGGVGSRYNPVMPKLGETYHVATFDRRRCSGSRDPADESISLTNPSQEADDVARLIRELGGPRACIFGCSTGATIALDLASRRPELCDAVVAHEAPTIALIPDAVDQYAHSYEVVDDFRRHGPRVAGRLLHARHRGLDEDPAWVFKQDSTTKETTVRDAGIPNGDYFFQSEFLPMLLYTPDLHVLRHNGVKLALACGKESRGDPTGRCALRQAEILGAPLIVFPGHHLVFLYDFTGPLLASLHALRKLPKVGWKRREIESKL